jgi:hypothetical protein
MDTRCFSSREASLPFHSFEGIQDAVGYHVADHPVLADTLDQNPDVGAQERFAALELEKTGAPGGQVVEKFQEFFRGELLPVLPDRVVAIAVITVEVAAVGDGQVNIKRTPLVEKVADREAGQHLYPFICET